MNQEPESDGKSKDDPAGRFLFVVVALGAAALLLRFLVHLLSDGWSAAGTDVPAGKMVFYFVIAIGVFLLGPWLVDRGHRTTGKTVIFLVAGTVALTLLAAMPSCNGGYSGSGDLNYNRR